MMASVEVMVLVSVGVVSVVYAFSLDVRRGVRSDRFLAWLKTERNAEWEALSRGDRFLPGRAIEILRRGPLAADAEFQSRYQTTRHGRRFGIAMTVAAAAIALLILGTSHLEWTW